MSVTEPTAAAPKSVLGEGITLLQASAGTGKTFRITHTLLRLVAEEGVPVDRIVVVTFTIAATAELRDRVRRRLQEAWRGMVARSSGRTLDGLDEVLDAWLETAPEEATPRLRQALVDFDDASIMTIHGFCNRALARHAFESGAAFDEELVGDVASLLDEVVIDFWTKLVVDAPADLLPALAAGGLDRKALFDLAEKVVDPDRPVLPEGPVEASLPDLAPWREALSAAREAWMDHGADVVQLLHDSDAILKRAKKGSGSYPAGRTRDAAYAMDTWCRRDPALIAPVHWAVEYFSPAAVESATRESHEAPEHALFDALQAYIDEHERLRPEMVAWVLLLKKELVETVRAEVPRLLQRRHIRTYDQMLRMLRDALRDPARKGALVSALQRDYEVALIDESQDTDPVQWEIFHTAFGRRLCLIGDPKQAIYGFRGADVYTYRRAARMRDHEDTLDRNFRSDPLLVEAINHLFGRDELRLPFGTKDIPFEEVEPHHEEPRLLGDDRPPLELRFAPRNGAKTKKGMIAGWFLEKRLPGVVADDIVAELQRGLSRRVGMDEVRPVGPGDCAVLVRYHYQARNVQAALRERGIPSVLRDERSVLESDEARELLRVLGAVLDPQTGVVRAAMCTSMLGRSGSEVAALQAHDGAWSEIRQRFRSWYELWDQHGIAVMLRDLFDAEGVASRLLRQGRARSYANLLHIAELLHHAALHQQLGPVGLFSWLGRKGPGADPDEAALRLESDADAVHVVTMHSCKGLEYPLVWCPFLWQSGYLSDMDAMHLRFHDPDEDSALRLDIGSPDMAAHLELAKEEQLQEDLRLLYVALTRARHRCTVYQGAGAFSSALAYILHQDPEDGDDELATRAFNRLRSDKRMAEQLESLAEHPGIALSRIDWGADAGPGWSPPLDDTPIVARSIERDAPPDRWWRRVSFSSMTRGVSPTHPAPHRDMDGDAEVEEEPESAPASPKDEVPLHDLPGGTRVGTMLHRIFELHDFARPEDLGSVVASELGARGFDPDWFPRVTDGVQAALDTPLNEQGIKLADLGRSQRLDELDFVLPIRGGFGADGSMFSVKDLAAVFDAEDAPAGYAKRLRGLAFLPVRGFLVGSIDLFFEHDGRFYVVDYKSNRLGARWSDYAPDELTHEMLVSNYTLQYHLYTLAAHRFLAHRVEGYEYEKHFGGVFYLFLRGMAPERGPASGVYADRPALSLVERLDALMTGASS